MKMKMNQKMWATLCVLMAAVVAAPLWQGCASSARVENSSVSLGQQLQDLEKAHQSGTISDKEYEQLRKSLIKKYR